MCFLVWTNPKQLTGFALMVGSIQNGIAMLAPSHETKHTLTI